jgi:hypothetical protein
VLREELSHFLRQRELGRWSEPIGIAGGFAVLGDTSNALKWLEKGYQEHSSSMQFLAVTPDFDGLRSTAQFQYWVDVLGLPGEPAVKISTQLSTQSERQGT